jgi:hypothetical protein
MECKKLQFLKDFTTESTEHTEKKTHITSPS